VPVLAPGTGKTKTGRLWTPAFARAGSMSATSGRSPASGRRRALRGVAIGRKNYLFAGSDAGGSRAAALYSLIETAKLNGLNPQHYLADLLARIADHPARQIAELLPWNWKPLDLTRSAA
jgi:hypothetical protein